MRQKIRRVITYISLFLFPITLNYFSPYLAIDGAIKGIISGSVILFILLFITSHIIGRSWRAWLCPVAALGELGATINSKPAAVRKLRVVRYSIFTLWFATLLVGFILAGGINHFDPFYMTENYISVSGPFEYITCYFVLLIFFGLTVWLCRRGACHSICWMSPFLVGGMSAGKAFGMPRLRIRSCPSRCTDCKKCTKKCPMSIDVNAEMKSGKISSSDCILCGECVDICPEKTLMYSFSRQKPGCDHIQPRHN